MAQSMQDQINELKAMVAALTAGLGGMTIGPGMISGDMIQPASIIAGKLKVQNLQSVSANTGALKWSDGSLHTSGASGAMPNPTKYWTITDGTNTYYIPAFSNFSAWTA